MTSPIQQKVTEVSFIDKSVIYCGEVLSKILAPYGTKYTVRQISNGSWEARQQSLEGTSVKFPLIALTISNIEDSPDFMWNNQALFNGIYYRDPNATGILKQIKLSYQKVTLSVNIQTENADDLFNMVKRWKFRERKAQFAIRGEGFSVTCKCLFDSQFMMPDQQMLDSGNLFNSSSSVHLYTYIGECIEIPDIKVGNVVEQVKEYSTVLDNRIIVRKGRL